MKPIALNLKGFRKPRALPTAWVERWTALTTTGQQYWRSRAPREQRLIILMGVVVGLALVFLLFIQPALRSLDRYGTELPQLRARAASVDAVVQEALALRGQPGARIRKEAMSAELTDSLNRAGMTGRFTLTERSDPPAQAWDIVLNDVSAAALIDWLARTPSQTGLTLITMKVERARAASGKPMAGKVTGQFTLRGAQP